MNTRQFQTLVLFACFAPQAVSAAGGKIAKQKAGPKPATEDIARATRSVKSTRASSKYKLYGQRLAQQTGVVAADVATIPVAPLVVLSNPWLLQFNPIGNVIAGTRHDIGQLARDARRGPQKIAAQVRSAARAQLVSARHKAYDAR